MSSGNDNGQGGNGNGNGHPCFLRGTRILTPDGERPVEALAIGDLVTTLSGAAKPLRWIGMGRTLITPLNRERCMPIRVAKDALGICTPHRDLYITRGHCLFVQGRLIAAEHLINHRSITWVETAQVVEFYHLELEAHDVLVADGAPAESYREDDNSALFHNADTRPGPHLIEPCAPILEAGPELLRIWTMLSDRVPASFITTDDPDLHLVCNGTRVDAIAREDGVWRFRVDHAIDDLRIVSRSGVPSMLGYHQDQRRLGVALRRVILVREGVRLEIGWNGPLTGGFNNPEPAEGHCWTMGEGRLPSDVASMFPTGAEIELHVAAVARYPVTRESTARAA